MDDYGFKVGLKYFFETVNKYFLGKVIFVSEDYKRVVINNASWIADTGRFSKFESGVATYNETEVYQKSTEVTIYIDTLTSSFKWKHDLPADSV